MSYSYPCRFLCRCRVKSSCERPSPNLFMSQSSTSRSLRSVSHRLDCSFLYSVFLSNLLQWDPYRTPSSITEPIPFQPSRPFEVTLVVESRINGNKTRTYPTLELCPSPSTSLPLCIHSSSYNFDCPELETISLTLPPDLGPTKSPYSTR